MSTTTPPVQTGTRTPDLMQAITALQHGNRLRIERARVLREISDTPRAQLDERVSPLLSGDPPRELRTLTSRRFLLRLPGVGAMRADAMLRQAGIASADRSLGALTSRQRDALIEQVRDHARRGRPVPRPAAREDA